MSVSPSKITDEEVYLNAARCWDTHEKEKRWHRIDVATAVSTRVEAPYSYGQNHADAYAGLFPRPSM